jgi:hypothetical protein
VNKQKKLILAALLIVLMVPIILIMALVAIRMQYTDGPGSDPLSQTERDLRSMQIALDSFHMDLARYPLESASHYIQDASLMHGSSRYMFLTTLSLISVRYLLTPLPETVSSIIVISFRVHKIPICSPVWDRIRMLT